MTTGSWTFVYFFICCHMVYRTGRWHLQESLISIMFVVQVLCQYSYNTFNQYIPEE